MTSHPSSSTSENIFEEVGDEFSWASYFHRTGFLAVDLFAFHQVESSLRHLSSNNADSSSSSNDGTKAIVDLIKIGRFVDVQDIRDPRTVWPAEILENVGGRLLLKYVCIQDSGPPFWEFYLSERVHPAGVCDSDIGREIGLYYALPSTCDDAGLKPPSEVTDELVKITKNYTLDKEFFRDRPNLKPHNFAVGMCLEAVEPTRNGSMFYPAKVVEILNQYYFVIEYNTTLSKRTEQDEPLRRTCHVGTAGLFPIGFAGQRGLAFAAPEGFDWASYLRDMRGKITPEICFIKAEPDKRFAAGRRLEAVNPDAPHQICAGTIIKRVENLIWIHLDSSNFVTETFVADYRSTNLFPCGWCAANGYPLKAPYDHSSKEFRTAIAHLNTSMVNYSSDQHLVTPAAVQGAYMPEYLLPGTAMPWSPAIYITRCFTGPHICSFRLSTMPAQIGPGPMTDVLAKVAKLLISSTWRPRDILMDLKADDSPENKRLQPVDIKAKYRLRRFRGTIDLPVHPDQIPEWCRQLCIRLEACPGLIAFKPYVNKKCPFVCHRAPKTKIVGFAKPISGMAVRRLKNRLAYQQKRREMGSSARRRGRPRRISSSIQGAENKANANRPVTRGSRARTVMTCLREEASRNNTGQPQWLSDPNGENHRSISANEIGDFPRSSSSSSMDSDVDYENGSLYPCGAVANDVDDSTSDSSPEQGFTNGHDIENEVWQRNGIYARHIAIPLVETNPLHWTTDQLYNWLSGTAISEGILYQLKDELVDGQAFMLMNINDVRDYLGLKLGPALQVCDVIKALKMVFLNLYGDEDGDPYPSKEPVYEM